MRYIVLFLVFLLHSSWSVQGKPETMLRIEVHREGLDIPVGSFLAKPKAIYRAGNQFCRYEEAEDTANGIHGLMIVNEPDAWMVNLSNKTGRHVVDSGPTLNCRLPIFVPATPEPSSISAVQDLQFGYELEFFKKMGAKAEPGPVEQGQNTLQYKVEIGDSKLVMFTVGAPKEHPLAIARALHGKGEVYVYTSYSEIPFDTKLFSKPEGIAIEDFKN
jgi:hypothetical protein